MNLQVSIHDPRPWASDPVEWVNYSGKAVATARVVSLRGHGASVDVFVRTSQSARELAEGFARVAADLAEQETAAEEARTIAALQHALRPAGTL